MKPMCRKIPAVLFLWLLTAAIPVSSVWASGIQEQEINSIPAGSYAGNYIRNSEKYTAVVEIENGAIQSISLKYNGSPLTEKWALRQAERVIEANSTRVKTVASPERRNKSVVKAIELALQAGLKLTE